MTKQELTIDRQLKEKLEKLGAVLVFMYGSMVSGHKTQMSDIDIGILLQKSVYQNEYHKKRLALLDIFNEQVKKTVDVVILNNASPLLAQMIVCHGKIIFCSNERIKNQFILKTLHRFDDALFLRRTYYHYLEKRAFSNKLGEIL